VDCCRTDDPPDGGYASAAALVVSLAVAILAAGLVMRGVGMLKLARADFRRAQAEYALSGAQVLAVTRLLNGSGFGRLTWSVGGADTGGVTMLAEAEGAKLRLAAVADLDDKALAGLDPIDLAQARQRLTALDGTTATPDEITAVDAGPTWRACAASAISPWGGAQALKLGPTRAPDQEPGGARAGQVWRVRATTEDGWTDERIVRLIGRAEQPGAVIWRRFGRDVNRGVTCDKTIGTQATGPGATPATP
jgi:hypothetical protein